MNTKDKLNLLADHIEKMEHTKERYPKRGEHSFNMSTFIQPIRDATGTVCGTCCCIGGEAV